MILLSGADLILPDRILSPGTLVIDGDRIAEVISHAVPVDSEIVVSLAGHLVLPGFIDVHVHGLDGVDLVDTADAVAAMSARLPRFGVTAFSPTTIACAPDTLDRVLRHVNAFRQRDAGSGARVLAAHVESGFINPEYRGAQPLECILTGERLRPARASDESWAGADVLRVIGEHAADVGVVTIAPEVEGGMDLIGWLRERNIRASLGHSGATYEQARDAIAAGAVRATHLYNRMSPMAHRAPGLTGAVLASREVAAEIIGDGVHVHPSVVGWTVTAKGADRVMAITDGTAAAGLPDGARATLGGLSIAVQSGAARLSDGTLAGSVVTMDGVFRMLVNAAGLSPVAAATICATTPAREMGLSNCGVISPGAIADLVVLDRRLEVVSTYVAGQRVFSKF